MRRRRRNTSLAELKQAPNRLTAIVAQLKAEREGALALALRITQMLVAAGVEMVTVRGRSGTATPVTKPTHTTHAAPAETRKKKRVVSEATKAKQRAAWVTRKQHAAAQKQAAATAGVVNPAAAFPAYPDALPHDADEAVIQGARARRQQAFAPPPADSRGLGDF